MQGKSYLEEPKDGLEKERILLFPSAFLAIYERLKVVKELIEWYGNVATMMLEKLSRHRLYLRSIDQISNKSSDIF